jgi:hypothetical protein
MDTETPERPHDQTPVARERAGVAKTTRTQTALILTAADGRGSALKLKHFFRFFLCTHAFAHVLAKRADRTGMESGGPAKVARLG